MIPFITSWLNQSSIYLEELSVAPNPALSLASLIICTTSKTGSDILLELIRFMVKFNLICKILISLPWRSLGLVHSRSLCLGSPVAVRVRFLFPSEAEEARLLGPVRLKLLRLRYLWQPDIFEWSVRFIYLKLWYSMNFNDHISNLYLMTPGPCCTKLTGGCISTGSWLQFEKSWERCGHTLRVAVNVKSNDTFALAWAHCRTLL